jgi:hypothetical protein
MYPGSRYTGAARAVTIPLPVDLADSALIEWASGVLTAIFGALEVPSA